MDVERWRRVKEHFHGVVGLSGRERAAYLEGLRAEDDQLAAEVSSLLAAHEQGGEFLEEAVAAGRREVESAGRVERMVGRAIGPYRIRRLLGQGGMGEVYLAERADAAFEKEVAIKLIRWGHSTAEALRRFRTERQTLAQLEHPGIARLVDGGATEEGLPYLVMEYVDGEPIDEHCRRRGLTVEERIRLFRTVCEAVQYAHRNLIVHRDLKPGNILVTPAGEVKLLDFGIAKLLPGGGEETIMMTRPERAVMSLKYAAPEQVRGEPITTTTDVYALGVLLYGLLTGRHPYLFQTTALGEVARVICEEEPEPLTAAITAEDSGAGRERLRRRLKGDLEDIVFKTLRKEPARRYASVEQLSEDLRRHLEGFPVLASGEALSYRAGKFMRRHAVGVAASLAVVVALAAGLLVAAWQARVAERQRVRAEKRFQDVRALANSFLFEFHEAIKDLPGATQARALVVKRAREYLDSLAAEAGDDPELKRELATAYQRVGDIQGNPFQPNLGDAKGALESYRRALELRRELASVPGAEPELVRQLARSHDAVGEILEWTGEREAAIASYRRALALREARWAAAPEDPLARRDLAVSSYKLGAAYYALGAHEEAQTYYGNALAAFEAMATASPGDSWTERALAVSHQSLGDLLGARGAHQRALSQYREALALAERIAAREPANPNVRRDLSITHSRVGTALTDLGQYEEAEAAHRRALAVAQELAAADPRNAQFQRDLAICHSKLGRTLVLAEDAGAGERELRKAIAIAARRAEEDPENAGHLQDLAFFHGLLGEALASRDLWGALESYSEARGYYERHLARDPGNERSRDDLVELLLATGEAHQRLADRQARGSAAWRSHHQAAVSAFRQGRSVLTKRQQRPEEPPEGELARRFDEGIARSRQAATEG